MADSYYPDTEDAPDESAPAESAPADESESGDKSEKADVETSLVPMSFLGGGEKEVGDVCKIKIVAIHDGEAEIAYVKHKADSEESDDSDSEGDGDMDIADSMASGRMG